jgi:uncharacterized membrane protein
MARRSRAARRATARAEPPPPTAAASGAIALVAAASIAALALRLLGARGDLWLDEILSVELARIVASPRGLVSVPDAFTDNNHLLNSLWLYVVAATSEPIVQRAHSVVAGTLSVPLAWAFGRRWGGATSRVAAVLFAGAFVMVHYGSEARGYAMLTVFTLAALVALDRWHERGAARWMVAFWGASILGMLAHLTYVQVLVAAAIWSAWTLSRAGGEMRLVAPRLASAFVVPAAAALILYLGFFSRIHVLGGTESRPIDVLAETAGYLLGLPRYGGGAWLALIIVLGVLAAAIGTLRHRRDPSWVLLAMLSVGGPAVMILAVPMDHLTPRYLMVPMIGLLFAMAIVLGRLMERSQIRRRVALAALAAVLVMNGLDTVRLLRDGRGHYRQALADMAAASTAPILRIAGDHPFRHRFVIGYHQTALPPGYSTRYVAVDQLGQAAADWIVLHSFDPDRDPPLRQTQDPMGRAYILFRTYPSGPLSGWHSYVYRRGNSP